PADRRVQSPRADTARAAGDSPGVRLRGHGYRAQEPGRTFLDCRALPLPERDGADLGDSMAAVARQPAAGAQAPRRSKLTRDVALENALSLHRPEVLRLVRRRVPG